MWGADASATGAGVGKEWPGGQISENADHSGWYDVVFPEEIRKEAFPYENSYKVNQ